MTVSLESQTPASEENLPQFPLVTGIIGALSAIGVGLMTYLVLAGETSIDPSREVVIGLLIANLALVLGLVGLIGWQIRKVWLARRRGSAGARLHVRLVTLFAMVAVV
ncbi:MAG: PAS domain-containing sensor histidine kinase, partial [Alphaproteobacteria bacterium]